MCHKGIIFVSLLADQYAKEGSIPNIITKYSFLFKYEHLPEKYSKIINSKYKYNHDDGHLRKSSSRLEENFNTDNSSSFHYDCYFDVHTIWFKT